MHDNRGIYIPLSPPPLGGEGDEIRPYFGGKRNQRRKKEDKEKVRGKEIHRDADKNKL